MEQPDGSAHHCFGGNVAHHRPVGSAGKPSVGYQGDAVTKTLTDESAGNGKHFPHSRAAFWPLVADDNNVAFYDFAALYSLEREFLLLEHPGGSFVYAFLMTGDLDDSAVGSQVAAQDRQSAGGTARLVGVVDDRLVLDDGRIVDIFGQSLSVYGHCVAVEQASIEQALSDQGHPAVTTEVCHDVAAAWFHVGDVRSVAANAVEIFQRQADFGLPRNGHEVQHGVGGASHGDHHGDGVFKGFPGENVSRADSFLQHTHYGFTSPARFVRLAGINSRERGIARQRHAHHFDGGGHGIGGEQAGAGTLAGAGVALQISQLFSGHAAGGVGAHRFEHVLDVDVLAVPLAGQDAAPVNENRRYVQAGDGHHTAGHVLVAAGYGH